MRAVFVDRPPRGEAEHLIAAAVGQDRLRPADERDAGRRGARSGRRPAADRDDRCCSAGSRRRAPSRSRCVTPLTAPCVPTGMNAGVCTSPCAVVITPRRARPSVWVTRKPKGRHHAKFMRSAGRETCRVIREKAARRRDLRRPIRRARGVARLGGGRLQEPRSATATSRSPIRIEKDGRWTLPPRPPSLVSAADVIHARTRRASPTPAAKRISSPTRAATRSSTIDRRDDQVAVVGARRSTSCFPVLHGPYGEDGTVQGLLELANVPYVGAGVLASAVGMDKATMKLVFAARGLPICDYEVVLKRDWRRDERARHAHGRRPRWASRCSSSRPTSDRASASRRPSTPRSSARRSTLAAEFDRKIVVEAAVPAGARDRVRGARQRRARGVGARRDHPVARVLRLRGEVPRRRARSR